MADAAAAPDASEATPEEIIRFCISSFEVLSFKEMACSDTQHCYLLAKLDWTNLAQKSCKHLARYYLARQAS